MLIPAAQPEDLPAIAALIEGGVLDRTRQPPFDLEQIRRALQETEATGE
jgi:hypothetical protein